MRVWSYFLLHELRVAFQYELQVITYCTSYELVFTYELLFIVRWATVMLIV